MYLKTDVLLLCDVFEKFISVCVKDYGLDPGTQLEKIHDIDMHLFLEKGMRGGVSYISKRYSRADENNTIMYWDANNLYGWTMIQDLPYGGFKILSQKEVDNFDLDSIGENSPIGYIVEVDLEYCKELHNSHSDYLLCPGKIEVSNDMLSGIVKILLIAME